MTRSRMGVLVLVCAQEGNLCQRAQKVFPGQFCPSPPPKTPNLDGLAQVSRRLPAKLLLPPKVKPTPRGCHQPFLLYLFIFISRNRVSIKHFSYFITLSRELFSKFTLEPGGIRAVLCCPPALALENLFLSWWWRGFKATLPPPFPKKKYFCL